MGVYKVLPDSQDPDADSASAILRSIVGEPANVVYVLLHNDKGLARMQEVAIGRAEALANVRRVVYVPEPDVLEPEQLKEIRGTSTATVAAVYGLNDKVVRRLKSGDAKRTLKVEQAFTAAESTGRAS